MHRSVLLVAALAVLAACGGSDGAATPSSAEASTTATAGGAESTVPDSTASSDAPDTTTPPDTAPADTGTGDATLECMQGQWRADAGEHQRRIDDLSIALPMTVGGDSVSSLSIDGDAFVTDSSISLTTSIGAATLTSSSTSHIEGTFTIDDGIVVSADVTVMENEDGEFVATAPDGSVISVPTGGFDPPPASPTFQGSTVSCDDDSLTFDVIGSEFGTITYARAG